MTSTPKAPRPTVDEEAIWHHLRMALDRRTPFAIWTAIADIPVLLAELERVGMLLTSARTEFADLLAAARASLGAVEDGEPDPLLYLRDHVAAQGPEWDRR
jgi:hypothetical protein